MSDNKDLIERKVSQITHTNYRYYRQLTSGLFHSCAQKDLEDPPLEESSDRMAANCYLYEIYDMMTVMLSTYYACMTCQ